MANELNSKRLAVCGLLLCVLTGCESEKKVSESRLTKLMATAQVNGENFKSGVQSCINNIEMGRCKAAVIAGESYIKSLSDLCGEIESYCEQRDNWQIQLQQFEHSIDAALQ